MTFPAADLHILLAEDNDDDAVLIERAFASIDPTTHLFRVTDGQQAWDYLTRFGAFDNRHDYRFPDAVLTDLNMPRLNGIELLHRVRHEPNFVHLPLWMLSDSLLIKHAEEAASAGANGFFLKPATAAEWPMRLRRVLAAMHQLASR